MSNLKITPADEANKAARQARPSKLYKDDNEIMDCIAFTPTLDLMPKNHSIVTGAIKSHKIKALVAIGRPKAELTSKQDTWGTKRYRCKYCVETFRWASRLQTHLLSHDGQGNGNANGRLGSTGERKDKGEEKGNRDGGQEQSKVVGKKVEQKSLLEIFGATWQNVKPGIKR
jgi:hypothetical protein